MKSVYIIWIRPRYDDYQLSGEVSISAGATEAALGLVKRIKSLKRENGANHILGSFSGETLGGITMVHLFEYHIWANNQLLTQLDSLPTEVFQREIVSSFPSISKTLSHIVHVDGLWLARLEGRNMPAKPEPFQTVQVARETAAALYGEYFHFLQNADAHLEIAYQTTNQEPFTNTVEEIIQHVVNHGTHHRGNIATMLRQCGLHMTPTDYFRYLKQTRNPT